MNRRSFLSSMAAVGGSLMFGHWAVGQDHVSATQPSSSATQAEAIRDAATRFLQTLTPDRRNRVTFAFPTGASPTAIDFGAMRGGPGHNGGPASGPSHQPFDAAHNGHRPDGGQHGGPGNGASRPAAGEKYGQSVWTNFPVNIVPRPGLQMGELATAERAAVHTLLQEVLSPKGYQKVLDIMAADQTLADNGVDYSAGLEVYTIGLFGLPSATEPWMLQFGGHHLGLNVTFVRDRAVLAPLHTGILPSTFDQGGRTVRALGGENDKAFDLLATFTSEQLKSATIDHEVSDLVCGPGRPKVALSPQGLQGDDMTNAQQRIMFGLIHEWIGMLNDAQTAQRLEQIRTDLPKTRFAWSGPATHQPGQNGEAYFRIHGPSLLVEFAPQNNQGGYKLHVHTVVRDLNNDYGKDWLT